MSHSKARSIQFCSTLLTGTNNIQISCEGQCHLGAATSLQKASYVSKKVKMWCEVYKVLLKPRVILPTVLGIAGVI